MQSYGLSNLGKQESRKRMSLLIFYWIVLVATRNAHKTREIREILGPNFEVRDLSKHPGMCRPRRKGAHSGKRGLKAIAVSSNCQVSSSPTIPDWRWTRSTAPRNLFRALRRRESDRSGEHREVTRGNCRTGDRRSKIGAISLRLALARQGDARHVRGSCGRNDCRSSARDRRIRLRSGFPTDRIRPDIWRTRRGKKIGSATGPARSESARVSAELAPMTPENAAPVAAVLGARVVPAAHRSAPPSDLVADFLDSGPRAPVEHGDHIAVSRHHLRTNRNFDMDWPEASGRASAYSHRRAPAASSK